MFATNWLYFKILPDSLIETTMEQQMTSISDYIIVCLFQNYKNIWKTHKFEGIFIDPFDNDIMPLKSYYDPLPKSDIKVMTEMQKTVRIQFNSVTINGEVMYLRLFALNSL